MFFSLLRISKIDKMYESGVRALLWGVESGTRRILDLIDKSTHVTDVEKVIKAAKSLVRD
jgi:hypothetical protein